MPATPAGEVMVAMLPDPHFRDIAYRSPGWAGDEGMVRSFRDTISQSRILNESYFSLRAALDEVVARGIRIVVMPGDLTEDGQVADVEAFIALTGYYRREHGLMFFATFGNHDAWGMTGRHHNAATHIGPDGARIAVDSTVDANLFTPGYAAMMQRLGDFGFFRRETFLHWETPFGGSDALGDRRYEVVSADGCNRASAIDASYLVEPVAGLWLLGLDCSVYVPRNGAVDLTHASGYFDGKDGKWDAVVRHRPYMLDWMADVKRRADAEGKVLLVYSHYAMAPTDDPRPGQYAESDEDAASRETTALLARTGIGVHFSGHSHVCNVGCWCEDGTVLTDVALPALCGFPPAFRVLRARPGSVAVTTVPVCAAPGSDGLFAAYRREVERDASLAPALAELAGSRDFGDFMGRQLGVAVRRVLARKHFGRDFMALAETPLNDCARTLGAGGVAGLEGVSLIEAVADWYRLSRAGELALPHVGAGRCAAYAALGRQLAGRGNETGAWPIVRRLLVQLGEMAAAPYAVDLTLPN